MRPAQLTRSDLTRTLGEIDDLAAAQLLSLGATMTELETAMRLVEHERTDEVTEPSSAHLASLVDVLREIVETNEPEYLGTD
ncbi:MAG: hypothetical protein K8M05_39375 [Deltaproteobacteria bacterium]|nr:hypothetical protein [Kofleriaceae bacterium]